MLQCVSGRGEHGGNAERNQRDVRRATDHDLRVVEPEAHQRDQKTELKREEGEAEGQARKHFERELRPERMDGELQHVAGERHRQERRIAREAEQGPF